MTSSKPLSLAGKHATLSPSSYHWLNYDAEKLRRVFFEQQQKKRGNELHEYAQRAIKLGIRQADNGSTLSSYINDCIGFRMEPEVPLYYSDDCFGTSDAVGFGRNNVLRIFDLKTGVTPASMTQILIYAGLFCLQMRLDPLKNVKEFDLRLYQNDKIEQLIADPVEIMLTMDKIKAAADYVAFLREEAED